MSHSQSQTSKEHDELINLALCYEAEYVLSLKLQEDMMRSRSSASASSSEYYDDGYEITQGMCPSASSCADQKLPCSMVGLMPEIDTNNGELESMETNTANYHWPPHTSHLMGSQKPQSPSNAHLQSVGLFQGLFQTPSSCNGSYRNGCSLVDDVGPHSEGPAKKRICLHK